jgi:hypothetical protein
MMPNDGALVLAHLIIADREVKSRAARLGQAKRWQMKYPEKWTPGVIARLEAELAAAQEKLDTVRPAA